MTITEHLKTLAEQPSDKVAKRFIAGIAARRVATRLLSSDLDERPNLSEIASQILEEGGLTLPSEIRERVLAVVRVIVEGVLDDAEPSAVTERFKEWQAGGRVDGNCLFEALQVPIAKRLRWVLQKFGSLNQRISPAELFSEFFLKLHKSGLPDTLENRKQFYWYSETVMKTLLLDTIRSDNTMKRAVGKQQSLEEILGELNDSGNLDGGSALVPETFIDISNALESLPDEVREVLRRRFLWGWTFEEIMQELRISRAKADRLQRMGLTSLRKALTDGGYSSSGNR